MFFFVDFMEPSNLFSATVSWLSNAYILMCIMLGKWNEKH